MRRYLSALPMLAMLAALSYCAAPPPTPPPAPTRPPSTMTPPRAAPPMDWQDAPLVPGNWRYLRDGTSGSSSATYATGGDAGGANALAITCLRSQRVLSFQLARSLVGEIARGVTDLTIITTFGSKKYAIITSPDSQGTILFRIPAFDPFLDSVAYSRGRFGLTAPGGGRWIFPAWPEVARVLEDCRE